MSESYVLETKDLAIKCYITYTKKSKYLKISVSNGQVQVIIPRFVAPSVAIDFIEKKQAWVVKRYLQEQIKQNNIKLYWPNELLSGITLFFRGEQYQLLLNYSVIKKNEIKLLINLELVQLCLYLPLKFLGNQILIKQQLRLELAKILLKDTEELVNKYTLLIGKAPEVIRIKKLKSLWGSCSSSSNITINWSLIFAPYVVLEYIVVHEMSHLRHLNHGERFWQLVERCLPRYKENEKWLKENSWILQHNF